MSGTAAAATAARGDRGRALARAADGAAGAARAAATARIELRMTLTSGGPWIIGLVLAALGYLIARTAVDSSSFPIAWRLSSELGPLASVLLLFLAASLAHRPRRYEAEELIESKRVAPEELGLGRWAAMVAAILLPLLLGYGGAMAGQALHSAAPVRPAFYAAALLRVLPGALFFATLAFALVTLTRVLLLGAGLAGLLWFALAFGAEFYPTALRPDLSQNRWVFLGLTAAILLGMLAADRGRRRAKRAVATWLLAGGAAGVLLATLLHAGWVALALPGKERAAATYERLGATALRRAAAGVGNAGEPLPNMAWTAVQRRRVSLAGLRGRPALLVCFQPTDADLLPLLARLERLRAELAPERLEILGLCLSEDLNAGAEAARAARVGFPVVTDWGKPDTGEREPPLPPSAFSRLLRIRSTPLALLVDAEGRLLRFGLPLGARSADDLRLRIRAALRGEPELPGLDAAGSGFALPGAPPP